MATVSSAIRWVFQIRFFICHCFSITQGYIIIIMCYLVLYYLVLNWNAVTKIFTSSNSLLEKLMCSWNLISFKEQYFVDSLDRPTFNHGWFYGYLRIIYYSSHWINYQWISPFFIFIHLFIILFIYLFLFVSLHQQSTHRPLSISERQETGAVGEAVPSRSSNCFVVSCHSRAFGLLLLTLINLNLFAAWISNDMTTKAWDEITYPFPNINGGAH